jgi:hypothetical protein
MTNKERMEYWRTQKMKTKEILLILNNIKREMNIQPPEKVLNKYIKIHEEELDEAVEAYNHYLEEVYKDEETI